jgi:PGF-pre-PGF domain-containing protein
MVSKKLLFIILLLVIISPVYGMNLTVTPENPFVGDDILLKGDANAFQILQPTVSFEKAVDAIGGTYVYKLTGIIIPQGENNFNVTSRNVIDLNVGIVTFLGTVDIIKVKAVNGTATISQSNLPKGTYDIGIHGIAMDGATSVPLTMTASSKIIADAQGNFSSTYSTSGIPAGTFNLNVENITKTITLRERPTQSTSSSGGSSGGGGGGSSGEKASNIDATEKYDLQISRDVLTSFRFTHVKNPMMFVNITGNTSLGIITASIEVLKNTSTLVNVLPGGLVYKNVNIWIGNAGFATPKNIKEGKVVFKVENTWITSGGFKDSDIVLVKWDGAKWISLETSPINKDGTFTYFVGKTTSFSPFAITAKAKEEVVTPILQISAVETPESQPSATPKPAEKNPVPGFELIFDIVAISIILLLINKKGL